MPNTIMLFEEFISEQESALYEKKYSTAERRDLEKLGHAMPGGRFPVADLADLKNAIWYLGKPGAVNGPEEVALFIARRMKELKGFQYENMFDKALASAGVGVNKAKEYLAKV